MFEIDFNSVSFPFAGKPRETVMKDVFMFSRRIFKQAEASKFSYQFYYSVGNYG